MIIPSYNEGRTICGILNRVLSVTLPFGLKKEIIVVDDGSEDETAHFVKAVYPEQSRSPGKVYCSSCESRQRYGDTHRNNVCYGRLCNYTGCRSRI